MPTRSLVWFRNDLRVTDNEALARAAASSDQIIPLFCVDRRWFAMQQPLNLPRMGDFRWHFLRESLQDLAKECQDLQGKLIVRVGKPEQIIPELVKAWEVAAVFTGEEVTDEETRAAQRVAQALDPLGVPLHQYWQSTLVHRDDLPLDGIEDLPDVFTHFRKKVEKGGLMVRDLWAAPTALHTPEGIASDPLPADPIEAIDARAAIAFKGGSKAAWARVDHYFWETDALSRYKETRNGLLGVDYSSKLSPWLAMGCCSPRQVWYEIQDYQRDRVSNDSTYWLIFELLWRDYFKFVALKFGNKIFQEGGIREEILPLRDDVDLFEKWTSGQTGNPFVDANMRELAATGFMSNRGRQNVASFLVKDLRLNWRWGAAYFESLLIDYDPASNWGNWCYVAGIGNDPRNDRYFNTRVQADRYDPKGTYIKHWIPELKALQPPYVHWPALMRQAQQREQQLHLGADYPYPVVEVRSPSQKK